LQVAIFPVAVAVAAIAACSFLFYFVPSSQRIHAGRRAAFQAREAMLNQETGLRGYLASRDPSYLEPFDAGTAQLAEANSTLEATIGSDATLAPLLLQTRLAEERWVERWAAVARRTEGGADAGFLASGRELFDAYRTAQRALGAALEARLESQDYVMRVTRAATLSLMVGLLGAMVFVGSRERRVRDRYEQRLLVLIRAAHELAESLDERRIVHVLERAAAGLSPPGAETRVVLADEPAAAHAEIASRAIKSGEPVGFSSAEAGTRGSPTAAVPMIVGGRVVGALVTKAAAPAHAPESHTKVLFEALANYGAAALESARLFRLAHEQGRVDALTHLFNRRRLDEDIADECRRSARYGRPLSILMIDVDHFKEYNDAHGHAAGDRALQDVAALLRSGVRLIDSVYRFGGEELAILLRETDIRGASVVAERLRAAVEANGKVTASFGIAQFDPKRPVPSHLIESADRALYAAKHGGRNRVCLATREEEAAHHLDA
jgi:diguanylate cyclase (GGDEF)-like protein